jgi:hypothetical protein
MNPSSKDIREKKSLKTKKAELIERNKSLSHSISSVLNIGNDSKTK